MDPRLLTVDLSGLTQTHTLGRTPLEEHSTRRRNLHPTTHNTHMRQKYPYARRDWNPQSQPASCRRPTP